MTDDTQTFDERAPSDRHDFDAWPDDRFGRSTVDVVNDHDGSSDQDADIIAENPATHRASLVDRVAGRMIRRPLAWWNAPWTNDRVVKLIATSAALTVSTVVIMLIVHFNPISPSRDLILDNTTPTGGDMGAHVWAPAFLRDHLIPNGQISGWSMDWYGGLPLYRFYMVIPALLIVLLDVVLPYGIAFKLVAMSGMVLFPIACWTFGRLAALRHPIPELFAFAGLCFLLDESFDIYGGNVKSTMAGEYSFSIALTLAMFGLGLLAHGLRTGKYRVWAAVVLSMACVSHGIVLIFVGIAATIFCLVWIDKTRAWYAVTTGLTTVLLSAWWVGPFLFGHEFMTDMKYGFRPNSATDSFWDMYFPLTPALDILIMTLAVIGFLTFVMRRELTGTAIGLTCILLAVLVWNTRESLPVIGLLWNPRLLPFVYLLRYLLMVVGALEVITWAVNAARARGADRSLTATEGGVAFAGLAISVLLVFGWMYEVLPNDGKVIETEGESAVYAWGPFRKPQPSGDDYRSRAVADGWTRYNWTGYEGKPSYAAYNHLVTTMGTIGEERGCGRAMWENNGDNSEYGTTMALMLLPHWTDGCVDSMEGLFFEATASTNYHFITAAAVSESSSNPVRQLRYTNTDADLGVRHMRDLGVRYLMVRTDAAKGEASTADGLQLVASSGTWEIYEVTESNIVEALTVEPVVVTQAEDDWFKPGDDRERNLELGTSWFQNPSDWPAVPVDEGPAEWQRITAEIVDDQRIEPFDDQLRKVDYVRPVGDLVPTELEPVIVNGVVIGDQTIDFDVDQIGVPVMVKVSYFPNWRVSGADGPYRAGANHMIVVPTSSHVTLSYDSRAGLDWFFYALTLLGVGLCILWRIRGDVTHRSVVPSFSTTTSTAAPVPVGASDFSRDADLVPAAAFGEPVGPPSKESLADFDEWSHLDEP
jgi:6-pyruvoyl-tetrahydropterin synthase related domain